MTTQSTPATDGRCARCQQSRVVFPAKPEWGDAPTPLCTSDWQLYAEARASKTYADWTDAFDNATDEEIAAHVDGSHAP